MILLTSQLQAKVENCEVDQEDLQTLLKNNEVTLVFRKKIIVEPRIKGDFLSPTNHDQFFYMKEAAAKKRKIAKVAIGAMELTNKGKIISFKGDEGSPVALINMNMTYEALKNSSEFTLVCGSKN